MIPAESAAKGADGLPFGRLVRESSGVDFNRCYQCLTCTLSCPVSFAMDYQPNQLMRMIQTGAGAEVLRSRTIWVCASCETCAARCPQGIDIPRVMDTLRQMALREKVAGREVAIPAFHRTFLKSIRRWGREYELGMVIGLKIKMRDFFSDISLGIRMLMKRKMSLLPHRIKGAAEIKAIFRKGWEVGED
ncbi:MAG: 4Fe-4S dicluster domain-containing protein [Chloroflexota bacterium]